MEQFKHDKIELGEIIIHLLYYEDFDPTDFLHLITEQEQERMLAFKHIDRQREFVATRILKHELFGYKKIEYSEHGAPFIKHEGYISISHTKKCCGIAVCESFKIGLDLELQSLKAQRLYSKFLNSHELEFLNPSHALEMTCSWSCKESLYKLAGRKQLIFKTDLLLLSKFGNNWKAEIRNPESTISVNLISILKDTFIISINSSAIEVSPTY